ncbi:MAG: FtsW/RodA/SpoVE family cell cycle protein [Lachnospiraceae bacterium]|nr:rod shape-determining protein RodA [Lachnospiraceae bacterium]MDD6617782.1 FtsW/RodA/SpoVE family cell cycle protein [Clostridiales bacterium]MDY4770354.1 FtsW/RodA/SpoVE family cell cycle protein [Lachnospiraceae bacterium]
MIKQYKLRFYNFKLVVLLLAISTIGILLVGSAMESLKSKQLFGVIFGMIILLVVSLMDFSWILNFYWFIYGFNIIMLLGIRIFGSTAGGATRWIDLGFIRFQPTELSKILLILFFAKYFMLHEKNLSELKTVGKSVGLLLVPLALIYNQPDLKNTITVVILFCVMIYVAGLGYRVIGGVLLIAIPLIVIFLSIVVQPDQKLIKDYQRQRIMSFLYPENEEYSDDIQQQQNSITAIGSGQLTGKGLNNNEVLSANNGNFVSEIQTDFIFAVAGEELGFIGCLTIVILLLLISIECMRNGLKSKDLSGKIICTGVATIVAFQSFINICVATGLMPNTGTPLPFVSYGLTSLWSLFIGMGLVINVGLQQNAYSDAASKSLVHKGVERKR